MHTQTHRHPLPPKQSPGKAERSASIRPNCEKVAHKRNRPSGILPTRIAGVERHIEGLCVAMDCQCCINKWHRALIVTGAMLEQNELYLERGEIKIETFSRNFKKLMEMQRQCRVQMYHREKRLREVEIPELRNLCSQADRAA